MTHSSILGGIRAASPASGKDVDSLGPSDTSDSGSDVQGERSLATAPDNPGEWGAVVTGTDNDSDALGTGERASADAEAPRDGADILPDRIIDLDDPEGGGAPFDADDLPDALEDDADGGPDDESEGDDEGEDKRRGVGR